MFTAGSAGRYDRALFFTKNHSAWRALIFFFFGNSFHPSHCSVDFTTQPAGDRGVLVLLHPGYVEGTFQFSLKTGAGL